jgi:murein DD-endopeptidase MepM/ murein hydrolase activator NlpD
MAKNSILAYTRRLGKSLKFAAVEVLKDQAPITTKMIENNRDYAKNSFKEIVGSRQAVGLKMKNLREQFIFKPVNDTFRNLKREITSGNFYHENENVAKAEQKMMMDLMSDMFGDMMEDFEDTDENNPGSKISRGDAVVASMISGQLRANTSSLSRVIAETTDVQLKNQKAISHAQFAQGERQIGIMNNGFSMLGQGMNSLIEFNNKVMLTYTQNATKYFETMSRLTNENNAILKELIDIQRSVYKDSFDTKTSRNQFKASKVFGSDGFSLENYFKSISGKANREGGTLETMKMFYASLPMFIAEFTGNPMKAITKSGISMAMGKDLKKAISGFDKNINGYIQSALAQVFDLGNGKKGMAKELSRIFGVKEEYKDFLKDFQSSNYNKGAIAWNGIAQKSLVEVIPGYLRKIESALTGETPRVFNYQTGRWTNELSAANSQKNIDTKLKREAFKELRESIAVALSNSDLGTANKQEYNRRKKEIINAANKLMDGVWKNGNFNPRDIDRILTKYKNKDNQYKSKDTSQETFDLVMNMFRASGQLGKQQAKISSTLAKKNEMVQNLFASGQGLVHEATNGSIKTSIGGEYMANNFVPPNARYKDKYGMSLYDYQYNIYKELFHIRNLLSSGGGPRSGSSRGGKADPTTAIDQAFLRQIKQKEKTIKSSVVENSNSNMSGATASALDAELTNALKAISGGTFKPKKKKGKLADTLTNKTTSFLDDVIKSSTIGDKLLTIQQGVQGIFKAPAGLLTTVIAGADEFMHDMLFGKNTNIKDEDGKPVKGLFNVMIHDMKEITNNLNKQINSILGSLRDKLAKTLPDKIKGFAKDWFGFDLDRGIAAAKAKVRRGVNFVKDNAKQGVQGVYGYARDSIQSSGREAAQFFGLNLPSAGRRYQSDAINSYVSQRGPVQSRLARLAEAERDIKHYASGVKYVNPSKGNVTLTTLHKGELVIPANMNPFNPERDSVNIGQQLSEEKDFKRRLISNIGHHAGGTSDLEIVEQLGAHNQAYADERNRNKGNFFTRGIDRATGKVSHAIGLNGLSTGIEQAFGIDPRKAALQFNDFAKKNMSNAVQGGAAGALLGTLFPLGGPLFGAMAGSAINIIKNNKTFQETVFGKDIVDEKGNVTHKEGLISKKWQDTLQKYMPDAKKYGTVGAISGLVLPFGPLGGAMLGASISVVKNNKDLNDFLFGDRGGLLNKNRKDLIKKHFPRVAAATIGTMVLGPFGLLGNSILGAGLGVLSTTDKFEELMLGIKDKNGVRRGGLAGAIRRHFTNPLKWTLQDIQKNMGRWLRDDMIKPIFNTVKPVTKLIGVYGLQSAKSITNFIKSKLDSPGLFFEKLFDKLGIGTKIGGWGKGLAKFVGRKAGSFAKGMERKVGGWANRKLIQKGYGTGSTEDQIRLIDENNMTGNVADVTRMMGEVGTDNYAGINMARAQMNDALDFAKNRKYRGEDYYLNQATKESYADFRAAADDIQEQTRGAVDLNALGIIDEFKNGKGVQGALDKLAKFKAKNGSVLSDEQYRSLVQTLKAGEKKVARAQEAAKVFNSNDNKDAIYEIADKVYKGLTRGIENPLIEKDDFRKLYLRVVRGDEDAIKEMEAISRVLGSRVNELQKRKGLSLNSRLDETEAEDNNLANKDMTQLYNFLTGNGGAKDMSDAVKKGFYDALYDDRKGFFVKLEKANEKIDKRQGEVLNTLQNFTNAIIPMISKSFLPFGMAEKVGLAPGARETFKVLHGKKLDDSIEHHAEGGIIGMAKGLFGGGSKSGGGLFGSLFGGGDSNKSSDGLEDVSTSSKPTDMRTRDEIAKDMGSVSAAGIIGANMSSSKGASSMGAGKNGITTVPTADGDTKEYAISSADGQLMEIPNKHNKEIDAKNQHKVQLQERSTVALERIAEKIGAGASKTGQKAKAAGGSLLDSLFGGPLSTIMNALASIPLIGPAIAAAVAKFGSKVKTVIKEGIKDIGKFIWGSAKSMANGLIPESLRTKAGEFVKKAGAAATRAAGAGNSFLGNLKGGIGKLFTSTAAKGLGGVAGYGLFDGGRYVYNKLTGDEAAAQESLSALPGDLAMGTGSMLANRFLGKRFGKPAGWLGGAAAMQAYKMANGQDFDLSDFALDLGGQALGDYAFTKLGGKFAKSGAKNLAKAEQIAASQAATKAAAGAAASGGGPGMISKLAAKFKGKGKVGAALAGLGALGFGLGSSSASEPETSGMTGQAQTDPQQGTGSILGGLGASLGATALVGKLGGGVGKMGAAGAAAYDIANGDFSSIPSDMYHGMVDSKALSMAGKGMSSLVAKGKDALGFAKEVGSDVTDAAAKAETQNSTIQALLAKLKDGITKVTGKLESVLPGKSVKAVKAFGAKLLERAAKPANIARAATKLIRQGAEAAAASTGIGAIVSAVIIVGGIISDFYHGYNNADEMLKLSEGTSSTGMKIVSGVVTAMCAAIPILGIIIPEDAVLEMGIEYIGPAFGFGKKELDELRRQKPRGKDEQSSSFSDNVDKAKDTLGDMVKSVKTGAKSVVEKVVEKANQFKDFVGNNLEWAKNKGLEMWGGLKQGASNIYNSVTSGISSAADTVKQGFNQGADWLKDKAGKAADTIGEAKTGLMNFFGIGNAGKGKTSKYGKGNFYSQLDSNYSMPFNAPGDSEAQTMADSGCGPVSAVNALSSLGVDVDPRMAAQYAIKGGFKETNGGTRPEFFSSFMNKAGMETDTLYDNDSIKRSLQAGNPVVLMGQDTAGESNRTPFAENPHYVTATGIDANGNVVVQDPETRQPNKIYKANDLLSKSTIAISARSKRYGSGKNVRYGRGTSSLRANNFHFGTGKFRYGRGGISADKMWALANWVAPKTGIDAKLIFAQWYHESAGFSSQLARENYNFGGMTQNEPTGDPKDKQPDGGNYYMHFGNEEEWAEYYAYYCNKCNEPSLSGSTDVTDFATRLKKNGYFGASIDEYVNGMNGAMSAIPSGQPNMSLIDNSKFGKRDPGKPSKATGGSSSGSSGATGFLSGFAKVAEIFSNALSFGTTSSSGGSSDGSNNAVNGDAAANAKQIFDFLKSKGLNDIQAAAICGNIEAESEYNPSAKNEIGAIGICQWLNDRATKLQSLASSKGKNWNDLSIQLEYLWSEIGPGGYYNQFVQAMANQSIEDAVVTWEKGFEVSGDTASYPRRIASAKAILDGKGTLPTSGKGKHLKARFGMGAGPQQLTLNATQTLTGVSPTPKANPLTASSPGQMLAQPTVKPAFAPTITQAQKENRAKTAAQAAAANKASSGADYSKGFFGRITGMAERMAAPLSKMTKMLGSTIMGSASKIFGNNLKFLFGDENPFSSILGMDSGNKSGSSSGGSQSGGAGSVATPQSGSAAAALQAGMGNAPITSPFGPRESPGGVGSTNHNGIDLGVAEGTPVPTPVDGTVDDVGSQGGPGSGYGNFVVIKDGKGMYHLFAHLSEQCVQKGDTVKSGTIVAKSGNTGASTGPHLHYTVTSDQSCAGMNGAVDPCQYSIEGLASGNAGKGKYGDASTPGFMSISRYGRGSTRIKVDYTANRGIDEGMYGLHEQIPKNTRSRFGRGKTSTFGRGFGSMIKNLASNAWGSIKSYGRSYLDGLKSSNFNLPIAKTSLEATNNGIAPNGIPYSDNDINYLVNTHGMSKADAIKVLSKDPKYTTAASGATGTPSGIQANSSNVGTGDLGAKLDKLIQEQSKTNELLSAIVQLANTFAKEGIKANVNGAAMPQSGANIGAMAASTVGAGAGVEGNFNRVGTTDISNYQSIIDNMNSIALR